MTETYGCPNHPEQDTIGYHYIRGLICTQCGETYQLLTARWNA